MTGALVYVRDKDSGEVYLGSDGLPRICYWPSEHDRASMMKVLASAVAEASMRYLCPPTKLPKWVL